LNEKMDVAKAFLIEANNDYDVVSILLENEKFNLATYHAQQAPSPIKPRISTSVPSVVFQIVPPHRS